MLDTAGNAPIGDPIPPAAPTGAGAKRPRKPYVRLSAARKRLPVLLVGSSVELHSVENFAFMIGSDSRLAIGILADLQVPLVYIGKWAYFSVHALEKALFYVSRFGGPGFCARGTTRYWSAVSPSKKRTRSFIPEPTRLPSSLIKRIKLERMEAEMRAAAGTRARNVRDSAHRLMRKNSERVRTLYSSELDSEPGNILNQAPDGQEPPDPLLEEDEEERKEDGNVAGGSENADREGPAPAVDAGDDGVGGDPLVQQPGGTEPGL